MILNSCHYVMLLWTLSAMAGENGYEDEKLKAFALVFDGIQMLLMGQGRSLTGGSADNDGVGSAGDLLLQGEVALRSNDGEVVRR